MADIVLNQTGRTASILTALSPDHYQLFIRAQPNKKQQPPPPWGTLEELLLASAVNRHGTDSWDSIAMEFNDLKRRFGFTTLRNDTASSLVDELRKLRVDELRREVHRRDASIV
ncbi:unnamed protein product [Dovyalis caffra]|uniref:Myb/SANT-like domain-containing protein n=1 Tax=Dovyalis caffra TaxID=77055 RepID=A0AAV1RSD5_9ROSI|nr:unnamed protein product [Dovyalis caffra]